MKIRHVTITLAAHYVGQLCHTQDLSYFPFQENSEAFLIPEIASQTDHIDEVEIFSVNSYGKTTYQQPVPEGGPDPAREGLVHIQCTYIGIVWECETAEVLLVPFSSILWRSLLTIHCIGQNARSCLRIPDCPFADPPQQIV